MGDLSGLVRRFGLNEHQCEQLSVVLAGLQDDLAPTSVHAPAAALDVHLADSLVALELDAVRDARSLADLGAGAGFPGLALAIALPASEIVLVESQARKCAFMERLCVAAQIGNAQVLNARAEEWREGIASRDAVTARALAPQPVVLEYAAPLLRGGGSLIDWRGRRDPEEEAAATAAARVLGLRLVEIRHVEPYAAAREHHLHVYEKAAATPARFPRRAGVARKRPLGC